VAADLRKKIVAFVHEVRTLDLKKLPSVSETIDWARVMLLLHASSLDPDLIRDTLNVLIKYEVDMETVMPQVSELIDKAERAFIPG
jgi:hypothetical protein